jgi:drug/metabolite transporter (DMT)-like permease
MRNGRVLIVVAAASFGALAFFAKAALREGVEPLTFVLGRFAVATAVLATLSVVRRTPRPDWRRLRPVLALGALVYGSQAVALTFALDRGDASTIAVLFATYPAIVVLGVATTRGRTSVGRHHYAALAGVLVGAVLVVGPDAGGAVEPVGVLLALGSAACFAAFVVASDALAPAVGGPLLATLTCVGATAAVSFAVAITGGVDTSAHTWGWLAMAAAGLLSTAFAFLAMFAALPRIGPVTAGITLGAEPVVTVLLSVAFLGDRLGAWQLVGSALVIGSVVVLGARTSRTTPALSA